jgi:hypothetical protein
MGAGVCPRIGAGVKNTGRAVTIIRRQDTSGIAWLLVDDGEFTLKVKGLGSLNDLAYDTALLAFTAKHPELASEEWVKGSLCKAGKFLGYVYVRKD